MPLSVSDLKESLPEFDEIERGSVLAVNGAEYTVSGKEVRSPGPGESVYYLFLSAKEENRVLSWSPGHSTETVWVYDKGENPMTDGEEVQEVEYPGAE